MRLWHVGKTKGNIMKEGTTKPVLRMSQKQETKSLV